MEVHTGLESAHKDAEYHYCKRKGHIAKVCRTKARNEGNKMAHKTHQVIEAIEDSHNEGLGDVTYSLYKMTSRKCDPIMTMAANRIFLRNLYFFCTCHNFFLLSSMQIIIIPACCLLCVL